MINVITPTTGTATMDLNLPTRTKGANVFTVAPTGDLTINAIPDGLAGQLYELHVQTVGTTSRTITFGSNLKSTGTLATGTTDGKLFIVSFVSMGSGLVEEGRTAAI